MDDNQVFWPNYLFFADMSDEKDSLVELPLGEVNQDTATMLAAILSTHDKGEGRAHWTDQANPAWGLVGAEILYNGVNKTSFASNGAFDHALLLKFPDSQTQPQGIVALNYNVGGLTPPAEVVAPETPPEETDASEDTSSAA